MPYRFHIAPNDDYHPRLSLRNRQAVFTENVAVIMLLKRIAPITAIRQWLAHPPTTDPRLREVMVYMRIHVTDDDIYRGISPLYARHVSISDANLLTTGPVNSQAYAKLEKQVEPDFETALLEWCRNYYVARLAEGMKSTYAARDRLPASASISELPPAPTGLAAVDQPLTLIAEMRVASAQLDQSLETNDATPELDELLAPASPATGRKSLFQRCQTGALIIL